MQITESKEYSYSDELEKVVLHLKINPEPWESSNQITLSVKKKNKIEALKELIERIDSSITMLQQAKKRIEAM